MANKKKQFDQEFKQNAVNYCLTHPELSRKECAKNLGIGDSTLYRWKQEAKANNNQATFKGSGNLTEAELENRRLKRELKDTQDALEILKKAGECNKQKFVLLDRPPCLGRWWHLRVG